MKFDSFRRKNIQMFATLMATATYTAGFNPPGGVWQDAAGHLPGDPIMRSTHHHRYLAFFYLNAAAFALSLMVAVVTLILTASRRKCGPRFDLPLRLLMLTATVACMAAFGTVASPDKFTAIWFIFLVGVVGLCCLLLSRCKSDDYEFDGDKKYRAKLNAPLSMFTLTISYVGGLSTPGGFWDSSEGGHRPGDTILHGLPLAMFSSFNSLLFVSSLLAVFYVMQGGRHVRFAAPVVANMVYYVMGLYIIGSSRGRLVTIGVICGMYAAVASYATIYVAVRIRFASFFKKHGVYASLLSSRSSFWKLVRAGGGGTSGSEEEEEEEEDVIAERQRGRASSLVQLLAGLAVSITYQAGMYPPGGTWQNGDKAGDPILLTTNPGRYKAFFYCNTVAFVASLLAILLGQTKKITEHHALLAAMILDLLALIVSYAIGSCRDQISTMYTLCITGAAVVYVVVHVQYFTLGMADTDEDAARVDKKCGRFLLFAILVASITYQAGLTPPGGFLLSGSRAGDPVLLYNYPRRYKAFFYCNSVSFMVSTVLLLLLVNPNLYRPAIRSHAISLCSVVSFVCLVGAFAAGSTQHLKTSSYVFVAAYLFLPILLTIVYSRLPRCDAQAQVTEKPHNARRSRNKIYQMTLAILVVGVTYQAGLDPPGGSWQSSSHAGHPVMLDKRRNRYLAFICGNSTAFVASIYHMSLILITACSCEMCEIMSQPMVVAQYLGFLMAYAAGSSRQWKTSALVGALVIIVLIYVGIHALLTICIKKKPHKPSKSSVQQPAQG